MLTKSDFEKLEQKLGVRLAQIDARFAQVETKIAESANRVILWNVTSTFSSAAMVIAVIKLVP